jgi:hypothetical protein
MNPGLYAEYVVEAEMAYRRLVVYPAAARHEAEAGGGHGRGAWARWTGNRLVAAGEWLRGPACSTTRRAYQ